MSVINTLSSGTQATTPTHTQPKKNLNLALTDEQLYAAATDVLTISDAGNARRRYQSWMNTGEPYVRGKAFYVKFNEDYFSLASERYSKILEEIDKKFATDDPLKQTHVEGLNRAYNHFLDIHTDALTRSLEYSIKSYERETDKKAIKVPVNPLVAHKDFNFEEFSRNYKELTRQFSVTFIQNMKSNNFKDALAKTQSTMSKHTTTSVNNISFADMQIIQSTLKSYETDTEWTGMEDLFASLANNNSASDGLRELFDTNHYETLTK